MASSWWKYGLCVFGGLGIGYAVGVRITKNKCEEDYENKVSDIREIYRNNRKASKPSKKNEVPEPEKTEVQTRTSIDMKSLSDLKKERAEQASKGYSQAFKPEQKPGTEEEDIPESVPEKEPEYTLPEGIRLVDELPDGFEPERHEVLKYHSDGVLSYSVSGGGGEVLDEDIPEMIGDPNVLKLLGPDKRSQLYIVNEQYGIYYTILFVWQPWSEVTKEEPYKAEL